MTTFSPNDDDVLRQVVPGGMLSDAIARNVLPHQSLDDIRARITELGLERPHLTRPATTPAPQASANDNGGTGGGAG